MQSQIHHAPGWTGQIRRPLGAWGWMKWRSDMQPRLTTVSTPIPRSQSEISGNSDGAPLRPSLALHQQRAMGTGGIPGRSVEESVGYRIARVSLIVDAHFRVRREGRGGGQRACRKGAAREGAEHAGTTLGRSSRRAIRPVRAVRRRARHRDRGRGRGLPRGCGPSVPQAAGPPHLTESPRTQQEDPG